MCDVEINIGDNRTGAKSKAPIQTFIGFFSNNESSSKEERMQILENFNDDPKFETPCCRIDVTEKESKTESCSQLYYTVCFGTWIFLNVGYGSIYFLILALLGIYLNAAIQGEKKDECLSCGKICTWVEENRSGNAANEPQQDLVCVPGPSSRP